VLPDNAAALVGAGVLSVIVCDLTLDPDRSGRNSNPKLVPAASAALQARATYVSVQASLNHDLAPSAGDARIRVDRCSTTYFSGRCGYLDGQGDTGEEAGARCCKATHGAGDLVGGGPNCRWAGWPSFGHAELP
jgi:hypothetical protein